MRDSQKLVYHDRNFAINWWLQSFHQPIPSLLSATNGCLRKVCGQKAIGPGPLIAIVFSDSIEKQRAHVVGSRKITPILPFVL
jgi:hypothetical protein